MKASTKVMFKKHGWRVDRFVHNYFYFLFYYPYVKAVYHLFRFLATYLSWCKPLNPVISMALSRYHSKVLSYGDTKKILTLNENVAATSPLNRQIIPFKYAYSIIFQEPEHIAVMDCPCKLTLGDTSENINSCLAVGKGVVSFWLEHGEKYHARKITQNEALGIIGRFRKMGYVTQAFFKVATGGQTGVVCNCHPDTCVSLQATRFARRFDKHLTMNAPAGYSVLHDESLCKHCGTCARVCPVECIQLVVNQSRTYDKDTCLWCELCVEHCPQEALSLYRDPEKVVPLDIDLVKKEYVQAAS